MSAPITHVIFWLISVVIALLIGRACAHYTWARFITLAIVAVFLSVLGSIAGSLIKLWMGLL